MGKIYRSSSLTAVLLVILLAGLLAGCKRTDGDGAQTETVPADAYETEDELYEKAKNEDVLVVYTVSTRIVDTKDSFEKAYPGLLVEVRDLRSPNLIEDVEDDYRKGLFECDVVLCNDNSGEFKSRLVDTGIVTTYLPADIAPHLDQSSGTVSFLNEAEMLFYNSNKYISCPVTNLWELTDPQYAGKVYMPNPLRSFSTYAFCASVFDHKEELESAYTDLYGEEYDKSKGDIAEFLWTGIAANTVFTNSSDEVMEAVGNGDADFGFFVSSKLRYKGLGYHMDAVYDLDPFSGCLASYSVMMAKNSKNVNSAKLFIRYLFGGADGQGVGYKPFLTAGTWPARDDVKGENDVSLSDCSFIIPDTDRLIEGRKELEEFFGNLVRQD